MHDTVCEGVRIRSVHSLPAWAPPLAVRYFNQAGSAPGRHKFADLVASDLLFPSDWTKSMRRDRLSRLLERPIELNGRLLVRTESRPAARRYEKTREVVVELGTLPPDARPTTTPSLQAVPAAPSVPVVPAASPVVFDDARFRALEARVEALERATAWCALPDAGPPSAGVPEPQAPLPAPAAAAPQDGPCDQDVVPPGGWRRELNGTGPVVPHHSLALRIAQHEVNLGTVFAARGVRAMVARDAMVAPAMGFRDAAARADRLWRSVLVGRDALGIQPTRGGETWPPAATWADLTDRVVSADMWMNKVRQETGWIELPKHPAMREPDAEVNGTFETPRHTARPDLEAEPDEERGE